MQLCSQSKKKRKDIMEQMHKILCERIEKRVGRTIRTPRDFDDLSMRIFDNTKTQVSPSTLKRLWGYISSDESKPRISTLDILAQFVGYTDWESFVKESSAGGVAESDFVLNNHIYVSSMNTGCLMELKWHPDRVVTVRFEGHDMFTVVASENSKLSVGDTFHVGQIIEGEPLYLQCLVHEGGQPVNYVCGKVGGVKYRLL